MDDISLVLLEHPRAGQHGADGARRHGVFPLDNEFVAVVRNEFHVLGVRAFTGVKHDRVRHIYVQIK